MAGGKDLDEVFPLAIAFELIHTATLVHDDIYDNAKTRRRPTLHEKFGLAKAMIAGRLDVCSRLWPWEVNLMRRL